MTQSAAAISPRIRHRLLTAALTAFCAMPAFADDAATEALMRKAQCFKCHALEKKKDGPPFSKIAAKYKGKAQAESSLYNFLSKENKIRIAGNDEVHEPVKSRNPDEIRAIVGWILSR